MKKFDITKINVKEFAKELKTSALSTKESSKKNISFLIDFIKQLRYTKTWKDIFIPENPQEHARLVRFLILTMGLFFLGSFLVFLISFTLVRTSIPIVRVPSVIQMDITDAIDILQQNKLKIYFEFTYSETENKYAIMQQYPVQGSSVRQGREVHLIVSLGSDRYIVPQLTQKTKKEAIELLNQLSIPYEFIIVPISPTTSMDKDTIIAMNIPAGEEVPRKTILALTITDSIHKNQYLMDNFIRQPIDFAVNTLINNDITPIIVTSNITSLADDGLIIEQNVEADTVLAKNSSVILTVGSYAHNAGDQDKLRWHVFQFTIPTGITTEQFMTNDDGTITANSNVNEQNYLAKDYRAILEDELGRRISIYERVGAEGSSIVRTFKSYGKTKVYVYANDEIIGSQEYGNQ